MNPLLLSITVAVLVSVVACTNPPSRAPGQPETRHSAGVRQDSDDIRNEGQSATTARSRELDDALEESLVSVPQPSLQRIRKQARARVAAEAIANGFMQAASQPVDRENYLHYVDNQLHVVAESPVSTFSIDVDTVSYSNVRRMLMQEGRLPPRDAVRIEELVNYFNYDYPGSASADRPFSVSMEMAPAPWDAGKHLLQIGLAGFQPQVENRAAANLVFLIDVSGSMQDPNKLGLVKRSLKLLVNEMTEIDRVALVVYAGAAGLVLDSTLASSKRRIHRAIDHLAAGGSTNGGAGIHLAYDVAAEHFIEGGINRVIIASDGDMNVGTVDLEALKDLVRQNRNSGVSLTTLGFGAGNFNDALMEQLADVGNGNAAYIDSIREAQKVLVEQMQSTLITIAKDVKIQVEFNPHRISEYRLIGYENRVLQREDFRNDKVDAGEIGAGHTVTALYEVVLAGSGAERVPELRYGGKSASAGEATADHDQSDELAYVRLRYKKPDGVTSTEFGQAILKDMVTDSIADASDNLRFSAAVAGFGQLLRGGRYTGRWSYDDAIELARGSRGDDRHGYRNEFVTMAQVARSVASAYNEG